MADKSPGSKCVGCPLYDIGQGFAKPVGPDKPKIILVGEALGEDEVAAGKPFVGKAGRILNRVIGRLGHNREDYGITNVIWCRPPENELVNAPYEKEAIAHCTRAYLHPYLRKNSNSTVVALGVTPTKHLIGPSYGGKLNDWHGTCTLSSHPDLSLPSLRVVPSFHPAYIARGNQDLIGAVLFDLRVAEEVADGKYVRDEPKLSIDPSPSSFEEWVEETIEAEAEAAVDIETAYKRGKSEDDLDGTKSPIVRINFATGRDLGITIPWTSDFHEASRRLLGNDRISKVFWHAQFDVPELEAAGYKVNGHIHDAMWAFHTLKTAFPLGLGFAAPFYSTAGPWKHLSDLEFEKYSALDAVQTMRVWQGVVADLKASGLWTIYERHIKLLDERVLWPAKQIGIAVSQQKLIPFKKHLLETKMALTEGLTTTFPGRLLKLHPRGGWTRKPIGDSFSVNYKRGQEKVSFDYTQDDVLTEHVEADVRVCFTCGYDGVVARHRCPKGEAQVVSVKKHVPRYFVREPFNPNSDDQIRAYAEMQGLKGRPGKDAKTDKASTGKKVLQGYARKDKFFKDLLDYRATEKIYSTYVIGSERRLQADGRLHPTFTHRPSTFRLSCVNPNLQNVAGERSSSSIRGFRACIVPSPGNVFVEADFAGIEAVETGWFINDPEYLRLARLGVHAYITSHLIKAPISLSWSDEDISEAIIEIKSRYPEDYDRAKRVVHGTNYGLTAKGVVLNYPDKFSYRQADGIQRLYFDLCPRLGPWQREVRDTAHRKTYLGGTDHPFGYRHDFWDVYSPKGTNAGNQPEYDFGPDAKRVVAYYPQSTSAGVLYESCLRLMDPENTAGYIAVDGASPIRALIHDSILCEVPRDKVDWLVERLVREMTMPIRQQPMSRLGLPGYLGIGVEVKTGNDWGSMSKVISVPGASRDLADLILEDEEDE